MAPKASIKKRPGRPPTRIRTIAEIERRDRLGYDRIQAQIEEAEQFQRELDMLARYKEDKDDDMEPTRKNIKMLKDQNKALHHLVHQKEEQIDLEEHKNRLIKNNYAVKLN